MKRKLKNIKLKDIEVYEHLEHHVKNTTYAHRLKLLQEMNEFVWLLRKKRIIPVRTK